jgi:hypothetical protein
LKKLIAETMLEFCNVDKCNLNGQMKPKYCLKHDQSINLKRPLAIDTRLLQ